MLAKLGAHALAIAVFIVFAICSVACEAGEKKLKINGGMFKELRAKVEAVDTTSDFFLLRASFATTRQYKPYKRDDLDLLSEKMLNWYSQHAYPEAIACATELVGKEYINSRAHLMLSLCHAALGDTSESKRQKWIADGLVKSIYQSGDGESDSTAFIIFLIHEEYTLLNALGFTNRRLQALDEIGDNYFDEITASNPSTGEEKEFYFDITVPYSKLRDSF
jgi:hypothetical protein